PCRVERALHGPARALRGARERHSGRPDGLASISGKVALAMSEGERTDVDNRRARHNYSIDERFEAGLVLQGAEVKALREGKGQIGEAYATVRDGEMFLLNMHISPYSGASTHVELDPNRPR